MQVAKLDRGQTHSPFYDMPCHVLVYHTMTVRLICWTATARKAKPKKQKTKEETANINFMRPRLARVVQPVQMS